MKNLHNIYKKEMIVNIENNAMVITMIVSKD